MMEQQRTFEQIEEHYKIEKRLADRLRNSSRQERQHLYTSLYDELFQRVPQHPQLIQKTSLRETRARVDYEMRNLRPFLDREATFLEVGPGDCALSLEVAKHVHKVYAVDVSSEITKDLNPPPNFELVLSNGASIPVPAHSIDVVYSNQLMEHLHPDDAVEQLDNIYTALAPGGIYLCITPSRLSGPHDISRYFDPVATGFHLKEYTVTELYHLFKQVGFSKLRAYVRIKTMYLSLPTFPIRCCERLLDLLPYAARKSLASRLPLAPFLGVQLVGTK